MELTIANPIARAAQIRAKFFPPTRPINIIRNPQKPVVETPKEGPSPQQIAHVMTYWLAMAEYSLPPFARVIRQVARAHGVPVEKMADPSKPTRLVHARQEAMYRGIYELGMSLSEVGRVLNRDHTTVLHGARMHMKRAGIGQ
jgi:Bacterial dnaA protein helix-turn-helix